MDVKEITDRIQINASALAVAEPGSKDAAAAQNELRAASYELHIATTPAHDWLHGFPYVTTEIGAVRCLFDLGILNAIPSGGSITYEDLSRQLNLSQDTVERLCRFTSTFGFLQSSEPDGIEHSATSKLAKDNALGVGFKIQHFPSSAYLMSEALRLDSHASEPNICGFALSHHIAPSKADEPLRPLWSILEGDPKMAAGFAAFMEFSNQSSQLGGAWIQDAFDWDNLPAGATVIDVGGGRGHVMLSLAERFPHLKYIVQDKTELIAELNSDSAKETSRVNGVSFMAHDFFTPQPMNASVFFFRKIFHDWSDSYAQQILQALNPVLRPDVKLIINDIVLPEPKGRPDYAEYVARRMDMTMMVMVDGKQRSLKQWQALICDAEPRWQFESVKIQEGSVNGVIVFTYV